MEREYLSYVKNACENGMTPEEVQNYFDIISRSNSRNGKEFLKITAIGISRAKKKSLNSNTIKQNQSNAGGYQYTYFKQ
jgi:hypothetical protein